MPASRPGIEEDTDAARLFEEHADSLLGYCHRQLGSRPEAEDAVQTTFIYALRALRRGVVPQCEEAWLTAIAKNVCHTHRRTRDRRGVLASDRDLDTFALVQPQGDADGMLAGIHEALASMPKNQRRAILLREWHGVPPREIASLLGMSQPATHALLTRARHSLADALTVARKPVTGVVTLILELRSQLAALFGGAAAKAAAVVVVGVGVGVGTAGAVAEASPELPPAPARAGVGDGAGAGSTRPAIAPSGSSTPARGRSGGDDALPPAGATTADRRGWARTVTTAPLPEPETQPSTPETQPSTPAATPEQRPRAPEVRDTAAAGPEPTTGGAPRRPAVELPPVEPPALPSVEPPALPPVELPPVEVPTVEAVPPPPVTEVPQVVPVDVRVEPPVSLPVLP